MKRPLSLVCILTLVMSVSSRAQTNTEPTRTGIKTYRFGAAVPVRECSFAGGNLGAELTAPYGAKFAHVGDRVVENTAYALIQFLPWSENNHLYERFNVVLTPEAIARRANAAVLRAETRGLASTEAEQKRRQADAEARIRSEDVLRTRTFCVVNSIFDRTATQVYQKFVTDLAVGVLVLPIKMRGGGSRDFDFSKDLTIGTVAGPRLRIASERDAFVSLLFGAGITAVTLDDENTGGAISEPTDRAAVTLTTGLMFELNRFQIGVMVGWDQISNPNQYDWEYQGHRWLSIGLGYTLLSTAPNSPAQGQK